MPIPIRVSNALVAASLLLTAPAPLLGAQEADSPRLTVDRIYGSRDFRSERFGPVRWLGDGTSYTTLERREDEPGRDIVRYDTETAARAVFVPAGELIPARDTIPLAIRNYAWSDEFERLLIFTNSKRVWRTNTRGDYWVLDRASGALQQLGGSEAPESSLMFAKFSPDGDRVGYVVKNNLYTEDLRTGQITQLTYDGSRTIINGTFDWVYEEEFGLRDGWRWSPDGSRIAFWQLDAEGVRDFNLINDTDSLYSQVTPVQYPKAGGTNSANRVGVVSADGGDITWFTMPGDSRNYYIARMEWAANSDQVVMQRLNRLQNTLDLLIGDVATGQVHSVLTERDEAWVETVDDFTWLDDGESFLWTSEKDGWNHAYVVSRDGATRRLLTPGEFDVISIVGVDTDEEWLYFIASPDNPTQRYLYRSPLEGEPRLERLSPVDQEGTHSYNVAPNFSWAFHNSHSFGAPPVTNLVSLPAHELVRPVVENTELHQRVAALDRGPAEFFSVDIGEGVSLNGWMIKPPNFDSTRQYPILFYVYGGPGSQTVRDSWGGSTYLWHVLLSQQDIIVASIDNRGTGARGRDFRKVIYGQLGVVETHDQAAAARVIGRRPYVDPTRVGIWGWSYGGFMSLNTLFQHGDVYSTAVVVAPVTHWKYYDTIYTERYNGLPQDNAEGYDKGSPLSYAEQMSGNLLVVHGGGDDNVHYQNTEALVNALVKANKQFRLMEYPNRTHGISGGGATLHLRGLLTDYILEHLADEERDVS
ncbi:MAG: S9 family peptidase [Gemmatimonadetes bacterium]|nr:S9 family peptidase [Gemmatimonadota bacterium]